MMQEEIDAELAAEEQLEAATATSMSDITSVNQDGTSACLGA